MWNGKKMNPLRNMDDSARIQDDNTICKKIIATILTFETISKFFLTFERVNNLY